MFRNPLEDEWWSCEISRSLIWELEDTRGHMVVTAVPPPPSPTSSTEYTSMLKCFTPNSFDHYSPMHVLYGPVQLEKLRRFENILVVRGLIVCVSFPPAFPSSSREWYSSVACATSLVSGSRNLEIFFSPNGLSGRRPAGDEQLAGGLEAHRSASSLSSSRHLTNTLLQNLYYRR